MIAFIFFGILILLSFFTPHVFNSPVSEVTQLPPFESWTHIFGTDDLGRDVYTRIIYGARVSLTMGFTSVLVTLIVGLSLSLLSVHSKHQGSGWLDFIIMRFTDFLMSLPSVLIALLIIAVIGPGYINTLVAVSLVGLPQMIRLSRSVFLGHLSSNYFQYLNSNGYSFFHMYILRLIPMAAPLILVQSIFAFSDALLNVGALGFLGLGVQAPIPEWGTMLSDARPYIESSPHLVTLPGLMIFISVFLLNIWGRKLSKKWEQT